MPALPAGILPCLLTRDRHQRIALEHTALGALLLVGGAGLMHAMATAGLNDGRFLSAWTGLALGAMAMMFVLIRSGWSRRLADPSLAVPQLLVSIGFAAFAYGIAGLGQGVGLLMVALILMFGMFGLAWWQAAGVGLYSISAFAVSMLMAHRVDPVVYPPAVQWSHLAMLVVLVTGFVAVSARLRGMRMRLRAQRNELAVALERISELATRDELTGLLNRRAMSDLLEAERQRTQRAGHRWSVIVLDIDHFKQVNDLHGHAGGDAVLRAVARTAQAAIRGSDALARWGGEEFVVLLRDTAIDAAGEVAERLRSDLAALAVRIGAADWRITVSAGVTQYAPGEATDAAVSRADDALYEAKAAGRNRVRLASLA
jgi:diguanylate cyclase